MIHLSDILEIREREKQKKLIIITKYRVTNLNKKSACSLAANKLLPRVCGKSLFWKNYKLRYLLKLIVADMINDFERNNDEFVECSGGEILRK